MKHLRQFRSIFFGELAAYFNSPIAYIFIVVFVMLTGILFMSNFFLIGNADMRYFFDLLPIILCVFIPAITMRIWAEERKGNTFELLLTFPMDSYKIVLGKFAAGFVFYLAALMGTIFIPLMLVFVGKPDIGPIIGGYIGACFVGAFFLSVGIFISGMCKDQIIAFIVSMVACFFFFLSGLDFIAATIDGWVPGLGVFLKTNFGMTRHFFGFEKGVIDTRDILYFIVMTSSFLVLNIFSIEDRMRPKAKMFFAGTVGVCLLISVLLNSLIFDIPMGRFDLTQGKIYTITQSTKDILKELKAPVMVKLYISPPDKMPTSFRTLEQEIKDQLEELKVVSNGKFNYKTFHMEVAQDAGQGQKKQTLEDRLQKKGIQPFQVKSIEEDEMGIKLIYSAISIAYKEKAEETIPRITPRDLQNMEYELMSKIYRMTLDKKPTVALVAPYSEKAVDPKVLRILRQLGQVPEQYRDDKYRALEALLKYEDYGFKRIRLSKDELIPDGTNTLIVVDPENMNERQRYEINRFLYEGGSVIVAAQNYLYDYSPSHRGVAIIPKKNQTGVNELLGNYGVTISDKLLMDNNDEVITITSGGFGPFAMSAPVKAPMQIMVDQEDMNQDISITSRLSSMFYPWGSSLELNNEDLSKQNIKKTVLFTSSEESWNDEYTGRPLGQQDIEHFGEFKGKQPLAVLLEGQFPNVFAGRTMPQWPVTDSQKGQKPENEGVPILNPHPGKLIVVGCSAMFQEEFVQKGGAVNFFINSVDAVTLGDKLIKIRSHQPINRTIKKLSKIQKLWYRFLTIVLIPLMVIAFGSIRAVLRKKEKEQYLTLIKSV